MTSDRPILRRRKQAFVINKGKASTSTSEELKAKQEAAEAERKAKEEAEKKAAEEAEKRPNKRERAKIKREEKEARRIAHEARQAAEMEAARKRREEKKKKPQGFFKTPEQALELLENRWPHLFDRDNPKPLAIGIREDLLREWGGNKTKLLKALRVYVKRLQYFDAVARGGSRYNIKGEPEGEVTPSNQKWSRDVYIAKSEKQAREQATSNETPPDKAPD